MAFASAIVALGTFQAVPANAQEIPTNADVVCIIDKVPPAARISVLDEALTGQRGDVMQFFSAAASTCMREQSWPRPYATKVWRFAIASAVVGASANRLERSGISPAVIRSWRDAQTADMRRNVDRQSERSRSLYAHLLSRGLPQALIDSNGAVIGVFIEALRTMEMGGDEGP